MIDEPLEMIGDGPVADITIQASGTHPLQFQANIGRVANLTLRQAAGEGNWCGADPGSEATWHVPVTVQTPLASDKAESSARAEPGSAEAQVLASAAGCRYR